MTRVIELIYTRERIWKGTNDDPVRLRYQLFTKGGVLICDHDPITMLWYTVWMEQLESLPITTPTEWTH